MDGILVYDDVQLRFDVAAQNDVSYGGLHCGQLLTIQVQKGKWVDTRIEKDTDDEILRWHFVGVGKAAPLIGHSVKVR